MSKSALPAQLPGKPWKKPEQLTSDPVSLHRTDSLAASITKAASRQTYYTVRFLVDRPRVDDAYRAYAYFRWVDDRLDRPGVSKREQKTFVERQKSLVERCYRGEQVSAANPQEQLLVELIRGDHDSDSGLQSYIQNMMEVMTFDANRRGSVVSAAELERYSLNLATAVTEVLHYFIGHESPAPYAPTRYLAATGAHIVHMLQDAAEDASMGYFNVSREYLAKHRLDPSNIESDGYREWVRQQLDLAKSYFSAGETYLARVPSARCRLAAFAYMARFKKVVRVIERDDYRLRSTYQDSTGWPTMLRLRV